MVADEDDPPPPEERLEPIEPVHPPVWLDEDAPSALPWKECGCGKCGLIWDATGNNNVAIACDEWGDAKDFIYGRIGEKRRRANARLIMSAGSLLSALKEACDVLDTAADALESEKLAEPEEVGDERYRIKRFRALIEFAESKRDVETVDED